MKASAAAAVFPRRAVGAASRVLGVLPGEGIGPEVIGSALRVLEQRRRRLPGGVGGDPAGGGAGRHPLLLGPGERCPPHPGSRGGPGGGAPGTDGGDRQGGGIPTVTRLWREVAAEAACSRGIDWELINVDFAAHRLIQDPRSFDVLVCPNLEGDVLADVGAVLLGSRGASFSENFTPSGLAVYQTNHGAAVDLAGRNVANPLGQIFSLAMLLRESCGSTEAADAIERAVETALARGYRTADLMGEGRAVGTREMTDRVIEALARRTSPA